MTATMRISLMLAVPSAPAAAWYQRALGATEAPWGVHRQGEFTDPFGHVWLVGDTSPLRGRA